MNLNYFMSVLLDQARAKGIVVAQISDRIFYAACASLSKRGIWKRKYSEYSNADCKQLSNADKTNVLGDKQLCLCGCIYKNI